MSRRGAAPPPALAGAFDAPSPGGARPLPPVQLAAPDIARWRDGGTGVDWVHRIDGPVAGPRAGAWALTHGNEICGAIALDWLLRQAAAGWRPLRGTLTLAFANVAAYGRFDPAAPFDARCVDEDLNRVWSDAALDGPRDSAELRRARALRPFVDAQDLLLDIHSMGEPGPPLMVCGTLDKHAAAARALGTPGELLIDTGHPAGLRMVERGRFGDPQRPECALLVECGQHWEAGAADVAIDTLVRFLGLAGLATPHWVAAHARRRLPAEQRLVRVTEAVVVRSPAFRFLVAPDNLAEVGPAGTPIAEDAGHVWRAPFDRTVLVMPGTRNLRPGVTAVRLGRFEPL